MDYNTYSPSALLESFVKCYWTLEAPVAEYPEKQRIVPDGCIEMIFHYGGRYRQYTSNTETILQPACFVFGQVTSPLEIEPTAHTGIFAVRFHPDGFMPFATLPIKEMENRAVPLETLFGPEALQLEAAMLQPIDAPQRISIIENFLLQQLIAPQTIDRIARAGVDAMLLLSGTGSVDALSVQLNINRRQLERRFAAAIGISPKQLAKIIRLQTTLKMLNQLPTGSLTALAHENGYYDQAHFIKDFKEFTGKPPGEFYAGNLTLSALFIGNN